MVHIIKIYFDTPGKEQEIRRLTVTNDIVYNFTLLLERIQTVFQLPSTDCLQIKWRDPENDFILMSSNDELAQALANAEEGLLRLYVSLKNEGSGSANIPKSDGPKEMHPFVVCDGCDGKILGARYKCLQCPNYDLCLSCDAAGKHSMHDMVKFVKPTYVPREWVFPGARKMWRSMFSRCPSNLFTYFVDPKEQAPNTENTPDPLNANCQANCNTVPKSAPSSSADNAPDTSQQKEKSPPNPNPNGTQQCPLGDFANFPQAFMNCLQNDFVDAPKLIHQGLNQVLKAVQGTIEVVDHQIYNPEFRKSQERFGSKTGSPTSSVPTQATESTSAEKPSTSARTQAPEVIFPPNPTVTEKAPIVEAHADNGKSSANEAVAENVDEITIDADHESSPNPTEESAACADGWTLLEGGDTSRMECTTEGTVTNATTEKEVVYPDLMEVEQNQESNRDKDYIQTTDPMIVSALITMRAMGFTNEGGWLERLLISKQGNINEALEALYPSIHHQ